MPRSPSNLNAGNFMVSLRLLSPDYKPTASIQKDFRSMLPDHSSPEDSVLFYFRRPALLTYHSRLTSLAHRLLQLPLYILSLRREAETLNIPLAEGVQFEKGWRNVPSAAFLELQAPNTNQIMETYAAVLKFHARLSGLRWLMYNHRIFSFVVFTFAFWTAEVLFTALGWLILSSYFKAPPTVKKEKINVDDTDASAAIKEDGEETDDVDLSDTPRSFPTYGRQAPLRYEPKVKNEEEEEALLDETSIQPLAAEADDESEELVGTASGQRWGRSDSGIGTSFSEGGEKVRADLLRRRGSRGGRGTGGR